MDENHNVCWTEKVESTSSVRDPLGLWQHLNIQVDYIPGITSVTKRIRYYTLLCWYYQNLFDTRLLNHDDFERLFILTCLSHHNGDYRYPGLRHLFNIQRFKEQWKDIEEFKLDFEINGFARTYYNKQISNLRCCWTDFLGETHKSNINRDLANCLPSVNINFFKNSIFTKDLILSNLSDFCLCQRNEKEIELMSKIMFGFMKFQDNNWSIDEDRFNAFIHNAKIDFSFQGIEFDTEEVIESDITKFHEMSQRRTNTLFMLLKIIHEVQPTSSDFKKAIYDALYFKRNIYTQNQIDFGPLSKVVDYWELLQLNVYFVYTIEMILDIIQKIVRNNNGIKRTDIFSSCDSDKITQQIEKRIGEKIDQNITLGKMQQIVERLSVSFNESNLFDSIYTSDDNEEILGDLVILLVLLRRRYRSISIEIKKTARQRKQIDIEDRLFIENLFHFIEKNTEMNVIFFLSLLFDWVIRRHLYESAVRFRQNNTKNWLFTEEDGGLFFSRSQLIDIYPRDNRWDSILSIMKDIEMIQGDSQYTLTDKGVLWLKKAGLT